MNCQFCNRECEKGESWPNWCFCLKCKTSYMLGFSGAIMLVYMDCIIDKECYQLQLNFTDNNSRIVILPDTVDGTMIMVVDFDFVLKNVTPTNLEYKIKTSVLFS